MGGVFYSSVEMESVYSTVPTDWATKIIWLFSSILSRWTNNEKLVDIQKYNLCFYSSIATIVCSRNTVRERESSHIFFFCGGDPFCDVVQRPDNTQDELTGLLEWPADLSPWFQRLLDLCRQSKITDLILSFQVPCGNMNILFASRIFFC